MLNNNNKMYSTKLSYTWRLVATGLSFAIFGLGGALISLGLLVSVYLAPLKRERKQLYSRLTIAWSFRLYITLLKYLGLLTYEVHDLDRLRSHGKLIIANHPSLLDVVFLISFTRQTDCVVKGSLWRNPFTFGPVSAAGFVRNDGPDFIRLCCQSLERGNSLVIFPEGTRSEPGKPLKMLRGAANIALESNAVMTPVIIRCEPATLRKKEKWYTIPQRPPHYVFRVLPDIEISDNREEGWTQSKAARRLTNQLEQFFTEHCQPCEQPQATGESPLYLASTANTMQR